MPDYLSPGVYVEEYESGARSVSGVSTSIPGFLGLAEKGGLRGLPQAVSSVADFQRKYGGYLSRGFGDYRFLRYAVEQFFLNGGSLCYVMRVGLGGAAAASRVVSFAHKFNGLIVTSKESAKEDFKITMTPIPKDGTPLTKDKDGNYVCELGLTAGDTVLLCGTPPAKKGDSAAAVRSGFFTVAGNTNAESKIVIFTSKLPVGIEDCFKDGGSVRLYAPYFKMSFDKPAVTLDNLSFNRQSANYFVTKCGAVNNLPFVISQEPEPCDNGVLFDWIKSGNAHEVVFKSGYPYIKLTAANEGLWGNKIKAVFEGGSTTKTSAGEHPEGAELSSCQVSGASNFRAGDIAAFLPSGAKSDWLSGSDARYAVVSEVSGDTVSFKKAVKLPKAGAYYLHLCDIRVKISCDDIEEVYEQLTLNADSPDYIGNRLSKSELVLLEANSAQITETRSDVLSHPFRLMFPENTGTTAELTLAGGNDGSLSEDMSEAFIGTGGTPGEKTGLTAFNDNTTISIIAAPGVTDVKIQGALVTHCDNLQSRFAILDAPRDSRTTDSLIAHRDTVESSFAAIYHPWLESYDYLDKVNIQLPPSGTMAGIYARVDQSRGVHKAPANESVKGITGLSCVYGQGEQSILNPRGINLIRAFPGQGIRVWGARTCSSDSLWRYINVRRLFIYIEESIKANTSWVVFEPNDQFLWLRVQRMIGEFLEGLWRDGALFGTSKEEAFFVEIGGTTMTQADIDNGRLICRIGVAPVKPAEFVIFRITQKTMDL